MTERCRYCRSNSLEAVPGFARLCRVTSDSKPWPPGGKLYCCRTCGGVQKPEDEAWRREVAAIYSNYTLFHQSGCADQPVFDEATGASMPRTERLVRQIIEGGGGLAEHGRMLDVGCGKGAMLEAIGRLRPAWNLHGNEQDDSVRSVVESLPGVVGFHAGAVDSIPYQFDLISLTHVLEHVAAPAEFLRTLAGKLAPGGRILIEVPNSAANPFDLVVADHCNHFTTDRLDAIVKASSLRTIFLSDRFIRKELTLLASADSGTPEPTIPATSFDAGGHVEWLHQVRDEAARWGEEGCGIFGTAIAGVWLSGELDARARFFVDEDPHRVGHLLLDRPIYSPADVPSPSRVFLPINGPSGAAIVARVARPGIFYQVPSRSI